MRSVICHLLLSLLLFAAPAAAQGTSDPRLQAAITAWLADDDASSLPVFAEMAAAGDRTAQLLISQIERETPAGGETEWVLALDRNARKDLFRAPGGLSGTPWVKQLARDGDPLALALEASKLPDATIETSKALYAEGEFEQARRLTWEILARGRFDAILSLPPEEPLFTALPYVPWMQGWFIGGAVSGEQRKWIKVAPSEGRMTGIILVSMLAPLLDRKLAPREPVLRVTRALQGAARDLIEEGPEAVDYAANLMARQARSDTDLGALNGMCTRLCPDEVGACILGSVALLGGYERVMIQDTPYEALISQADYVASPRAQNTAERRLRVAAKQFAGGSGYEVSQCLVGQMSQ